MNKINKTIKVIFKDKYLLVFLSNQLFFKQYYLMNKVYTLFYLMFILYKFGFINKF